MEFLRCWFTWSIFGIKMGWWKLRHSARDRALIMVRQGVYYDLELGHSIYQGKEGQIYAYGFKDVAYALNDPILKDTKPLNRDKFEVYEDERLLFVVDGEIVTCPLQGTGVPMEATKLSEFNRGDAVHQALESIHGPSHGFGGSWKLILAIAAIAIIAYVIYRYVLHGHIPGMPVTPTTTPMPSVAPGPTPTYIGPVISEWLNWIVS